MIKQTSLYKDKTFIGKFNTAQDIFNYIKEKDNIDLHCTCELDKYGYEMLEK